eukprot:CAMPEP_0114342172 /NCGR_PEP_ID=MMETSP0101-20121206/9598_1 /TAXON_ID=38822 ORGANISM="Pteridomonas danica, Strain PT" /NCGR_SAMPLE_ID=MMETSP0101 /ASSEMBLY_ACC=CAM_ASM_000211 /LENGTH=132 /DNA_ID=CAMNT_0001476143 /DNA_START=97 /DNA_END=495 /DNA_ORIENTATION=+
MNVARTLLRSAAPVARSSVSQSPAFAPRVMCVAQRQFPTQIVVRAFSASGFLDSKDVTARIIEVVSNFEKVDSAKVSPESKFEALDLDSLDVVEVVLAIEEEFAIEIPDAEADRILSIADAVQFIVAHPQAK